MNLLDLIIILAAAAYGFSGVRSGAVVGALSMVGFFTGAVIGAQLAEPIGSHVASGRSQVPVAIVCVLLFAMLGQLGGAWAGSHLRARYVRMEGARKADAGIGAVLGVLSVLVVAWMVAVPLASSPYPSLANAASHSAIVRGVDSVMPSDLRTLYSRLRSFLDRSGFPPVFGDLPSTSIVNVAPPDPNLSVATRAAVSRDQQSIVKIYGQAPSCGRGIEGSGFVIGPNRIVTNAHVVAGTNRVQVVLPTGHNVVAHVVVYDSQRDVAILDVPGLNLTPLHFAKKTGKTGQSAVVAGYPEDGPFTARSARVRALRTISGNNIYGHGTVRREVYTIRAVVQSGNSGGPLLATDGTVLGVVFAKDLSNPDTGFVLTNGEIASDVHTGLTATESVDTGKCTPE